MEWLEEGAETEGAGGRRAVAASVYPRLQFNKVLLCCRVAFREKKEKKKKEK